MGSRARADRGDLALVVSWTEAQKTLTAVSPMDLRLNQIPPAARREPWTAPPVLAWLWPGGMLQLFNLACSCPLLLKTRYSKYSK